MFLFSKGVMFRFHGVFGGVLGKHHPLSSDTLIFTQPSWSHAFQAFGFRRNCLVVSPFMETHQNERFYATNMFQKHNPYHPWDWYIYLHEWLTFMVNVGITHGWYEQWKHTHTPVQRQKKILANSLGCQVLEQFLGFATLRCLEKPNGDISWWFTMMQSIKTHKKQKRQQIQQVVVFKNMWEIPSNPTSPTCVTPPFEYFQISR